MVIHLTQVKFISSVTLTEEMVIESLHNLD